MKVAFILRKFPVLSETFILEQIVGLIEQGATVHIFSLFKGNQGDEHPLMSRYELLSLTRFPKIPCSPKLLSRILKSPLLFSSLKAKSLWRNVNSLNFFKYKRQAFFLNLLYFSSMFETVQTYDFVHCHFGMYGLIGVDLRALGLIKGKVITSFHGMDIHVYPKLSGPSVYKRLFSQGDLFTVNSHFTGECLIKLGCPSEKIAKLPVGLRTSEYTIGTDICCDDTVRVLTVARLVEKKGIDYGIRAIASLHAQFPQVRYEIVGDGPLRSHLNRLIQELDAAGYITLIGTRTQVELRQLYTKSDIFLLPSVTASNGDMEGQGLVLQEAQASGLPVVSTQHNGIPEGVLVDKSGFLVPERDVEALALSISKLVTNPGLRWEMGLVGQRFVCKNFDISHLNAQLMSLYKNIL